METATISLDHRELCVCVRAIAEKLVHDQGVLALLQITRERDLKRGERFALPLAMRLMSGDELQEQIDPWISLVMEDSSLLDTFGDAELQTSPPVIRKRREAKEIL